MSFKSVQAKIAKQEHIPMQNAGAIVAHASRSASAAAKRKNPNLNRVPGGRSEAIARRLRRAGSDSDYAD